MDDHSMKAVPKIKMRRVLLKLSGEAFQNHEASGINVSSLQKISEEIISIVSLGAEVAVVLGGGNIIRGAELSLHGFDRITADHMGMLGTLINGLALRDALETRNIAVKLMSSLSVPGLIPYYDRNKAIKALVEGKVVILVGGTGNPLVTTDSAAALRGIEINADIVLKATKVDGVFAADPIKNPKAKFYRELTYDDVIEQRLGIMDLNAIVLCRDNNLALRVFNMNQKEALKKILLGEEVGTLLQQ